MHPPPKLIDALMKEVKVKMVRRANEEVAKEKEQALEAMRKVAKARTPKKLGRFLAGKHEEIPPTVMNLLPSEVQRATINFYKF